MNRTRAKDTEDRDSEVLSVDGFVKLYNDLQDLVSPRVPKKVSANDVDKRIEAIRQALCDEPARLYAALYRPTAVSMGFDHKTRNSVPWMAWCWTSEAAWRALQASVDGTGPPLTEAEKARLAPVAARQRFLAFCEPFRHVTDMSQHHFTNLSKHVLGRDRGDLLVLYAREARSVWADFLDRHEDIPALDPAVDREIESEVDLLLFDHPNSPSTSAVERIRNLPRLTCSPLAITEEVFSTAESVKPTPTEDIQFSVRIIENHLLPRFRLESTVDIVRSLIGGSASSLILTWGTLLLAGMSVGLAFLSWFVPTLVFDWSTLGAAALAAAASYLCGFFGVVAHGRLWAVPWILRVPAASSIGLLMLITMNPAWWGSAFVRSGVELKGWEDAVVFVHPAIAIIVLCTASFGYLLINVRGIGIGRRTSVRRAALVWSVAAVHAFLIALIGLAWVIPVFSESGQVLRGYWITHSGAALLTVGQAATWCLVAGVFSQILWDDRPLTAPLSHARWRSDER